MNCTKPKKIVTRSTALHQTEKKDSVTPDFKDDRKIIPLLYSASKNPNDYPINYAFDKDYHSFYYSVSYDLETDVIIDVHFKENIERIDYISWHPRLGNSFGQVLIGKGSVMTAGNPEPEDFFTIAWENNEQIKNINIPEKHQNPRIIRFTLSEGENHGYKTMQFISVAEIEFWQRGNHSGVYSEYFTDKVYTAVQKKYTRKELLAIPDLFYRKLALALFDKNYPKTERIKNYQTYPDPWIKMKENKSVPYGLYDNATGIFAKKGEEIIVFVDQHFDDATPLGLYLVDHNKGWDPVQKIALKDGTNRFTVLEEGLFYLNYHSAYNHTVQLHFATGAVNGIFDLTKGDDQKVWNKVMRNTVTPHVDVLGHLSMLTFPKAVLKKVQNGPEWIRFFDEVVRLENEIFGLTKYHRMNKNRIYFRAHYDPAGTYGFATDYRTEYHPSWIQLQSILSTETLRRDSWGFAYEVGHINQISPSFSWAGIDEVSNNIASIYVGTKLDNPFVLQDWGGQNIYADAFQALAIGVQAHARMTDVARKLIPFWQLQLYFAHVKGYTDFYPDLHEQIRLQNNPSNHGAAQLNFIKTVCGLTQEDLTAFFTAWGFLMPIDYRYRW